MLRTTTLAAVGALIAAAATAQDATATLQNASGEEVGTATLALTPSGMIHAVVEASGIPEGAHGLHLHMVGDCTPPDFESAGGHLAGDHQHGVMVEGGPHPGDLPNAHVQADGVLAAEAFLATLTLDMVFDDDGTAIVIHAAADDYTSQPSGESGERIACGVLEQG